MSKDKKIDKSTASTPPGGLRVIAREFTKDKVALVSLFLLGAILVSVFVGAMIMNQEEVMKVNLLGRYLEPGVDGHILGTDEGGRDIFGQLIIGARNSIIIGFSITILTSLVGVSLGIVAGYYGGKFDGFLMRIVDFILILPTLMMIIVFVTVVKNYTIYHFIFIMSLFGWTYKARLFRTRTLSEASLDYVNASKTLGTSDFMIMFREILPNLSSLVIVNLTLNFAGNIGIETSLTYLGFGLPATVPSLGTLIANARSAEVLENKTWIWLPAAIFILVMMLCINYVGQAFQRAADAKQRLG
ncbi:peptide ABC transporter permease [Streptococcus azizii]|uniref:Peptide ABC transporter permease n=1 Tax=Streptococcus azizii TaxID=1579424 RepID=A0AB36JM19_9STRE|nr:MULTISPECIES: ABC transporter permease [Streptococcus]MBF0776437.1 ABC transporter permease [Streptococcus sp. 19428wD3_AN2]ONK25777.1 peptide ABC transporter permease [Streptococcus azizii]ONK30579.1 peptide ABC transporter permease [Streptococcus azizii]ONK30942.1 peptide ABC transporter permease [Streptococcus azizii]TFU83066.1 ABC transporter permease [Streptococcus sp. AN2]